MIRIGIAAAVLVFMTGSIAMAQPESISLICTGHQPLVGGENTGPVVIQASTAGIYTYGNPWQIDVGWQGAALMTDGVACGELVPKALNCFEKRSGPNLPFDLTQACGPIKYNTGFPRPDFSSSIILDQDHGYFNCQTLTVSMHIRLSDCKAQP